MGESEMVSLKYVDSLDKIPKTKRIANKKERRKMLKNAAEVGRSLKEFYGESLE